MDAVIGFALIGIGLAGLVSAYVGFAGLAGRLPRNRWAGIRTRATMASDEAWRAAHVAGGPALVFGGVAAFSICAAFVPFAFAGKIEVGVFAAVAGAAGAIVIVSALRGLASANRAAKNAIA